MSEEPFNGLTAREDEALSLLSEECAEVIVAVQKIQRHGMESSNPDGDGATNREDLERELGDLLASVRIAVKNCALARRRINHALKEKLERVRQYLHHAKVPS